MSKFIKNWFSNFEPFDEPFEYEGNTYTTPEHLYQAMKTLDPEQRSLIANAATPGSAKRLGRAVSIRSDWEQIKLDIMWGILKIKFAPGTTWAEKLLKAEEPIIEWNNWGDTFWGVDKITGNGQNHLGKLLMLIKKELENVD